MFSLPVLQRLSNVCVVALIGTEYLFPNNIVLGPLILHFPLCVYLVLILDLSICHDFCYPVQYAGSCYDLVQPNMSTISTHALI